MNNIRRHPIAFALATACMGSMGGIERASAANAEVLDKDSRQTLYQAQPVAQTLSHTAKAILVFPNMAKAGLVSGAAFGEGERIQGEAVAEYYNSITRSCGLQAVAQPYGHAVFLMTDKAVLYVEGTKGWKLGVGPTGVVVDEGVAKNLSSSSLKDDAYSLHLQAAGIDGGGQHRGDQDFANPSVNGHGGAEFRSAPNPVLLFA